MSHMTVCPKVFFENKLTTVWNGTYYYIEKSCDYAFFRKFYSGQKKRHLLKFCPLCFQTVIFWKPLVHI